MEAEAKRQRVFYNHQGEIIHNPEKYYAAQDTDQYNFNRGVWNTSGYHNFRCFTCGRVLKEDAKDFQCIICQLTNAGKDGKGGPGK